MAEVLLIGAGDIAACDASDDEKSAAIVERHLLDHPTAFAFTAGDNVYQSGTPDEFAACYAPSWGRFRDRTWPAPGNHDYRTAGARGYFDYFGPRAGKPGEGWYSKDVGAWHLVVLNSNCDQVDCGKGSAQIAWLKKDLERSRAECTIAIFHHPRFSSGPHGGAAETDPLWRTLALAKADVVIAGHEHVYERFVALGADGQPSASGIRSFTVGTGGRSHYPFRNPVAGSAVRLADTSGVIALWLTQGGYRWEFIDIDGKVQDRGSARCH